MRRARDGHLYAQLEPTPGSAVFVRWGGVGSAAWSVESPVSETVSGE